MAQRFVLLVALSFAACGQAAFAQSAEPRTVLYFEQPVYQTGGVEFISNGSFESNLTGWTVGSNAVVETTDAQSGSKCLRIGPGEGSVYRTVSLPPASLVDSATLTFWYRANAKSLAPVLCTIRDTATQTDLISPLATTVSTGIWSKVTVDVTTFLGRQIDVVFRSRTVQIGPGTQESTLWLDSVALKTDESVWVNPMTDLYLIARDVQNNLDYTQWRHGTSGLFTEYTAPFQVPTAGPVDRVLQYRSVDTSFAAEPIVTRPVKLNGYPPTSMLRYNQPHRLVGGTVIDAAEFELNWNGYSKSGGGDVFYSTGNQHSGTYCLLLRNGSVSMSKSVTIPAGSAPAVLSIWYAYQQGASGNGYLWVQAPFTGATLMLRSLTETTANGWTEMLLDVSSFEPYGVTLTFGVTNPSVDTSLLVDDIRYVRNATVYVSSQTDIDMLSGSLIQVSKREMRYGGGEWLALGIAPFQVTGSGAVGLSFSATDAMGWREHGSGGALTQVTVDSDGPAAMISVNNGAPVTQTTSVALNVVASDINNVQDMRFRNSTGLWGPWEGSAQTKNWTLEGGAPGTRTVIAEFRDLLGNVSQASDTINLISPQPFSSIGEAKLGGPYPVAASLTGRRITGVFAAGSYAYIQDPDRASGIKVNLASVGSAGMLAGRNLDVAGAISLDANGEPELYATSATPVGAILPTRPLNLNQRGLGGGSFGPEIPGVDHGAGLHNVGQLVRTTGRVVFRDLAKSRFVLNDGSATSPDGVWVELNGAAMPAPSAFVIVTGNLGCVLLDSKTLPMIRLRSPADLASP